MRGCILSALMCLAVAGCASTGSHESPADLSVSGNPGTLVASAEFTPPVAEGSVAAAPSADSTAVESVGATGDLYFLEFRSRSALSYGHTYAVHGRLNAQQEIIDQTVVGLHPKGDSAVPWMIGHIIPVPSETGPSDGDTEAEYITARFRVLLTKREYKDLVAYIAELEAGSPFWHAALYNCNMYIQRIAKHLKLRTPFTVWLYPDAFINKLGELNEGRVRTTAAAL